MFDDVRAVFAHASMPHARLTLLLALAALAGCASAPPASVESASAPAAAPAGHVGSALETHYRAWRGTPHRWGGLSHAGIDCSGFVFVTYRDVFGVRLPRDTGGQSRVGRAVSRGELRRGDLVFFAIGSDEGSGKDAKTRHVGIYVGGGEFIHASSSRGVMRSSLHHPYWRDAYWKSTRVVSH